MSESGSDTDKEPPKHVQKELKDLIQKRGVAKRKLSLFKKFVLSLSPGAITADQLLDLELRIDRVSSIYNEFEEIQDRIETISPDVEKQLTERETFENSYYTHLALGKRYMKVNAGETATPPPCGGHGHPPPSNDSIKYPEISLPSFNGEITEWIEFRDTFDAVVNHTNLKPIQKFRYLRGCLKGGALEVINSIDLSEDGYAIAWQLLCERYNKPKVLFYNHLRALFNVETVPDQAQSLRNFADSISKHMRTMQSFDNINTEGWDVLVIFFLSSKLDTIVQRKWEEKTSSNSELPTLQQFKSFQRARADLQDLLASTVPAGEPQPGPSRKALVTTSSPVQHTSKVIPKPYIYRRQCPNCKENHYINQCPKFLALNAPTRIRVVKKLGICINCLGTNHMVSNCRASNCRTCKGKHHTLLHLQSNPNHTQTNNTHTQSTMHTIPEPIIPQIPPESQTVNLFTNRQVANTTVQQTDKLIILSTAKVNIYDANNQLFTFRALLDSGSQANYITENAFKKLQLPTHRINMEVIGFNENITNINQLCNLTLQSRDGLYTTDMSFFVVPKICNLPSYTTNLPTLNIPRRYQLADESFLEGGDIDLILGAEQFYSLLCVGQHKLGEGLPILHRTRLGWVVSGAINIPFSPNQVRCNFVMNSYSQSIWNPSDDDDSLVLPDDDLTQCEKIFSTHKRASDGSFVVTIPLKESPSALGLSKPAVFKRFKTLESKFERDNEYKQGYVKFMREFKDAGHMIEIEPTEPCNYLPHHAVLTPHKTTTPLRVVIDASYKTSTGKSLNDIQFKGTMKQDNLFDILLRFRKNRFLISADIKNFYRMIFIEPNQRHLQCILWRENPTEPLVTYALTTLSFGLKCAPYVATRCLLQLANEYREEFPSAAAAITRDFFMDDFLHGGDDEQQVAETAVRVNQILRGANFNLRKWESNSPTILKAVSEDTHNNTQSNTVPTTLGPETPRKVLGLAWCSRSDKLLYSRKEEPMPKQLTKRKVLSISSAIFDPLGLLGPVIIVAKLYIQRLWQNKLDWDENLPNEWSNEWTMFYSKLYLLNSLRIPRQVLINDYVIIELHGFCDSSLSAYGAAIYMRSIDRCGSILVRLLCSKSRVARKETIPRLELRSAVLLTTLYNKVNSALKCNFTSKYFWSDSNVALAWIKSQTPEKLDTFVRNRINEIRKHTNYNEWHWIPSADNPADYLTRGLQADKLVSCSHWWEGPAWLSRSNDDWPSHASSSSQVDDNSAKPTSTDVSIKITFHDRDATYCNVSVTIQTNEFISCLFKKYSSFFKLQRCFAYILRFIHNLKNPNRKLTSSLSVYELNNSQTKLITFSQLESYPIEYNLLKNNKPIPQTSNILSLNPFMENGLIRVGGRLTHSPYQHDKKHPIILPHGHILSKLIARDEHVRLFHAGPQLLLSSMRERFWPLHGKSLANQIVHKCVRCFKAKPTTTTPIMGQLPSARVTPTAPFLSTGVDYAGPFTVRDRRGRGFKTYKCYIAIFVCLSTKAVHTELVTGLESTAFLSALRRFTARRGKPKELLSDNGTTFHGTNNELRELFKFLNVFSNDLISSSAIEGIEWKFLPAYTPHMGGLHEAAVKSCKFHLKRVLGQALLTYEEFSTILIQIKGILNSRPLCPIPSSNNDEVFCLTPAHFLIGRTPISIPDYDYISVPTNRLTHYQQLQQLQQDFWRRWSRDYISLLQERSKWRSCKGQGLSVGTVVLVKEARLPPCFWRLGRIVGCCQGRDGVTRVAQIQTARGIITRSFNVICPLPIDK